MRITFMLCACLFTATLFGQKWTLSEITFSTGPNSGKTFSGKPERFEGYTERSIFPDKDFSEYELRESQSEDGALLGLNVHFSKPSQKLTNVDSEIRFGVYTIRGKISSFSYRKDLSHPEGDLDEIWFAQLRENEIGFNVHRLWRKHLGKLSCYAGVGGGASVSNDAEIWNDQRYQWPGGSAEPPIPEGLDPEVSGERILTRDQSVYYIKASAPVGFEYRIKHFGVGLEYNYFVVYQRSGEINSLLRQSQISLNLGWVL